MLITNSPGQNFISAYGQSTQAQVSQQVTQIRQQIQQLMSQLPPQQQQQARRVFAPILAAINRAPSMMNRPGMAASMGTGMANSMMNRPVRQSEFLPIETRYYAGGVGGGFAQNQRLEQMLTQALSQLSVVSNQLSSLQGSGRVTAGLVPRDSSDYHGHFRSLDVSDAEGEK